MQQSFRLKIGLLSMCLSGILLIGFGLFSISALNRVGIERIDRELRALADAQVRKIEPPDHWQRFDESLRAIYDEDPSKLLIVKVTRSEGGTLYASDYWPQDLPQDTLPLSLSGAPESKPEGPPQGNAPPPAENDDWEGRRPRPQDEPPPRSPPPHRLSLRGPVYATLGSAGTGWRAMTIANNAITLSVAMNLSILHSETRRFEQALLVAIPLGLLLIVAGGWFIGHMALRPIHHYPTA